MFTRMYVKTSSFLATYKHDESGVTAIEYGLIGVAMATLLGVTFGSGGSLLTALTTAFANITAAIGNIG